ncbi:MAG: hypothetical protein KatS3mg113_0666 [Planctomycetaceae bacterium]|nr:MAG: hypothetical protein KatS3mg113_0666 [Planctomycetaceae bacterium]
MCRQVPRKVWLGCWSSWMIWIFSGCAATSGWMMNNSGLGYMQQGNYVLARHEFERAVALNPWNPEYRHNLALTLRRLGDTGTAERLLRYNLQVDPMHQPTYHALAELMNEQGRQGEAYELLQAWARSQPYVPQAHIELAWFQRQLGNMADAERELRHALQLEPQNPVALAHLGSLYQDMGEPRYAAMLYQQALAQNWNQPELQARLAMLEPQLRQQGSQPEMIGMPGTMAPGIWNGSPVMPQGMGPMMAGGPSPTSPPWIGAAPPAGAQPAGMAWGGPISLGNPYPGNPYQGALNVAPRYLAQRPQLPPPLFDQGVPVTTGYGTNPQQAVVISSWSTTPPSSMGSVVNTSQPPPLLVNGTVGSIPPETIPIPGDVTPSLTISQGIEQTSHAVPAPAVLPADGWQAVPPRQESSRKPRPPVHHHDAAELSVQPAQEIPQHPELKPVPETSHES